MTYNVFSGMLNPIQSINPDSLNKSSAIAEMGDHLATIYMSQKVGEGGCCTPFHGDSWVPI